MPTCLVNRLSRKQEGKTPRVHFPGRGNMLSGWLLVLVYAVLTGVIRLLQRVDTSFECVCRGLDHTIPADSSSKCRDFYSLTS